MKGCMTAEGKQTEALTGSGRYRRRNGCRQTEREREVGHGTLVLETDCVTRVGGANTHIHTHTQQ